MMSSPSEVNAAQQRDGTRIASTMLFGALLLITMVGRLAVPSDLPNASLDGSWVFGMNQAIAQRMVIGQDITFTFGPYAFLYTGAIHPGTNLALVCAGTYLALSYCLAALLNFRNSSPLLQIILLVSLAACTSRDALLFLYPLMVGVYLLRTAARPGSAVARLTRRQYVTLVLLLAPFGLLFLVKGTLLLVCLPVIGLAVPHLAARRDWPAIALLIMIPVVSCLFFWMAAGQPAASFPNYFLSILSIISGYTDAMSLPGRAIEIISYFIGSALLLISLLRIRELSSMTTLLMVALFVVVLFLAFKAGFVRHDMHAFIATNTLLLAAVLAATLGCGTQRWAVILATALITIFVQWSASGPGILDTMRSMAALYFNLGQAGRVAILDPESFDRAFDARVTEIKREGSLPVLSGTTDIYPFDQGYLIASGNNWNPRPVFQSYSAYTPELISKNLEHVRGPDGPDNVFFAVQAIDDRFPSLDDGATWPLLLASFRPTGMAGRYLILRREGPVGGLPAPATKILSTHNYSLGERIDLPDSSVPVFAKIRVNLSYLGKVVSALYKPSPLVIALQLADGREQHYRFIAGIGETGFLISPLVENSSEFALLYAGADFLSDKLVRSMTITPWGMQWMWQNTFELTLYTSDYATNPDDVKFLDLEQPLDSGKLTITAAKHCDGSIDTVNNRSPQTQALHANKILNVDGWLAIDAATAELPSSTYLFLAGEAGQSAVIRTRLEPRKDVAEYFKRPEMTASGFQVTADVSKLKGAYRLALAYSNGNSLELCGNLSIPIVIGTDGRQ